MDCCEHWVTKRNRSPTRSPFVSTVLTGRAFPPQAESHCSKIWYKVVGGGNVLVGRAKLEVRLLATSKGVAVAVFTEDPVRKTEVHGDAYTIQRFLDTRFPGCKVSIQKWRPWPPA